MMFTCGAECGTMYIAPHFFLVLSAIAAGLSVALTYFYNCVKVC